MKRTLTVGLVVVLAAFLTATVIYAIGNKAKENPKSQTEKVTTSVAAAQENEKQQHAEGSAECIEKHAKGECSGHEPGQPHEGANGQVHQDHTEGSAACQAKHASGECKGHQLGEKHSENHSKSQE